MPKVRYLRRGSIMDFVMLTSVRAIALAGATFIGGILILALLPLKLLPWTRGLGFRGISWVATCWADWVRRFLTRLPMRWTLEGDQPDPNKTYVVLANHQSWVDILAVLLAMGRGSPMPRFFMKFELLYVPVIGLAAWGLDYPIMRRYSAEAVKANPALKTRDLNYARRVLSAHPESACLVVNFAEGTRFSESKRIANRSPYRHLLKPKVGGPQLALDCLNSRIDGIVDLTLDYPNGKLSLWNLLAGKVPQARIHVRILAVPEAFQKTLTGLDELKAFRQWINQLWADKDARLSDWRGI